jgi:tetratricopeptide (TPR) repeat protein
MSNSPPDWPEPRPAPPPSLKAAAAPRVPAGPRRADRRERWVVLGLLGLGLLLRLITLAQAAGAPYFDDPILDSFVYDLWGQKIARGQWTGGPGLYEGATRVFFQDPLYAYFLGVLYLPGRSMVFVRLVQIAIGLCSCILVYAIGRRLVGRAAATLALAVVVTYKPFLFYDNLILKPVFEIFLLLLAAWLLLVAQERGRYRWWFAAGLALGVGALARGNYLAIVPVLVLWLRVAFPADGWGGALRRGAAIALGTLAGIAPATFHNIFAGGEFVPTTAHGGLNFFIGNHAGNTSGRYHPPPFVYGNPLLEERDFRKEAERRTGRAMSAGEVDRYWFKEGLRYAWAEPVAFLKGTARKCILFWHAYEYPDNNEDMAVLSRHIPILRWPLPIYALVSPLGLLGLGLALREWRRFLLPILLFGAYAGSLLLFFLFARYRLPAVPFLILFAAYAIVWIAKRFRAGARAAAARAACAGTALFLLTSVLGVYAVDMEARGFGTFRPTVGHFNLAKYWHARGHVEDAEQELRLALEIEERRAREGKKPWGRTHEIHTDLASIAIVRARHTDAKADAGRFESLMAQAKSHLDRALGLAPRSAAAYWQLGVWDRLRGDSPAAVKDLEKAIELQPALHDARLGLAETHWMAGDRAKANAALDEVLQKGTAAARAEALHLRGEMAFQSEDTTEARKAWEAAIACNPFHLGARRRMMNLERNLAEVYLKKKDIEAANISLLKAAFHAEAVYQLDPGDTTARVLLQQIEKARKKASAAKGPPVQAPPGPRRKP